MSVIDPHDLTPRQVLARRKAKKLPEVKHDRDVCGISPVMTCNECLFRIIAQDDWDRENDWRE